MKPRTLGQTIGRAMRTFPAIVVTGPRQSGKTTLLRTLYGTTHAFVTLEDPDVRIRAKEDPLAFLARHKPPVIIDEIQYVPELLSYIKTRIDEHRKPGQWLFTGSQHFGLMQGISQSLAGRAAVLTLLPFSVAERIGRGETALKAVDWVRTLPEFSEVEARLPLGEVLLRGNYPEIATRKAVDRQLWCASYISTFLERDVRNLAQIGDLSQFERFLRLCAVRTGQILNLSDLARDIGVSVPTAKRWLSVLEAGYQVYLLYPYYQNLGKRLVKSPKLYFNDTALASFLLGIHDQDTLFNSPSFGNLFETLIVTDVLKRFLHAGETAFALLSPDARRPGDRLGARARAKASSLRDQGCHDGLAQARRLAGADHERSEIVRPDCRDHRPSTGRLRREEGNLSLQLEGRHGYLRRSSRRCSSEERRKETRVPDIA